MWTWHATCIFGFVLFQVVGLPLAAAATIYFSKLSSRRQFPLLNALVLWMVIMSVLGAMVMNFQGDSYMLAGQMLLNICWYLFPFLPLMLWMAYEFASSRLAWNKQHLANVAIGVLAVAMLYQSIRRPSSLEMLCQNMGFTLTANEWEALRFLRDHTPSEAIVLMPLRPQPGLDPASQEAQRRLLSEVQNFAICSGLAGRAAYIEYAHSPEEFDRVREIVDLWQSSDETDFASRLRNTKATHLVEYPRFSPEAFYAGVPSCLEPVWESAPGSGRVRIWKVKQADGDEKR